MKFQQAKLEWREKQPYSRMYGDVYFSSDSGLDETRYVFLEHNQLSQRWKALDKDIFTIAETGFGTGLNFLSAWDLWNQVANKCARLHFVSTELHPLSSSDLAQALSIWPQLKHLSDQLISKYDDLIAGWHRFEFDNGRITLTLLIGHASNTLPELVAQVDAWFLDGFSPAKNPEMWRQSLFQTMAKLSTSHTTFATFTSASIVRKGLESAGFKVNKYPGYGKKREMLSGFYRADLVSKTSLNKEKHVIIIGGGLAGTSSAYAMAKRGWKVTLIERHPALAQEASGNALGILYPRLSPKDTLLNQIAIHGFLNTLRILQQYHLDNKDFNFCGVLQLSFSEREKARIEGIIASQNPLVRKVDQVEASKLAGITLLYDGMYINKGACINPAAFCDLMANHPNIMIKTETNALDLQYVANKWQVCNQKGLVAEAPVVILATANDTLSFKQTHHCTLLPVRGQTTLLPSNKSSAAIKSAICTDGYITPESNGFHCLGASFLPGDTSIEIRASEHQSNLTLLKNLAPSIQTKTADTMTGRAAIRCTTGDYLPMAGIVLNAETLESNPPRPSDSENSLVQLSGLYINTGHGSKGLVNAPLCAEIIASLINQEPLPVSQKLAGALNPNRFLLRRMGLKKLASALIKPLS